LPLLLALGCSDEQPDRVDPQQGGSRPVVSPYDDSFIQLGRYSFDGAPGPTFVEILDVEVDGQFVYLCTATKGLLVVDRNQASLPIVEVSGAELQPKRCQHVAVSEGELLIANRGDEFAPVQHLTLFDATDPTQLVERAQVLSTTLGFEGVAVVAPGVFAAALHSDGVALYEQRGDELVELNRVDGLNNAWDLAVGGARVFIADGDGVAVFDPAASGSPLPLSAKLALQGSVKHVELGDGMLFAAAGAAGVHVLAIDEPDAPKLITTIETPGSALMSAYSDGRLYVADWIDVRVFDLTVPTEPRLVATENIDTDAPFSRVLALDAAKDHAYLGEWTGLYDYQLLEEKPAPDIRVSSTSLKFPPTAPGDKSAQGLFITNEGSEPLRIVRIELEAPYAALDESLTIAPNDIAFLEVRFRPSDDLIAIGELHLLNEDPDEGDVVIDLRGNVAGLGVGDPIGDYQWVNLQDDGAIGTKALRGNVLVLSYFATF